MARPEGGRSRALVLWSLVLLVVTADVVLGGPLTRLDSRSVSWLSLHVDRPVVENGGRHTPLQLVLLALTELGAPIVLVVVVPWFLVLSIRRRSLRPLALLAGGGLLLLATVYAGKVGFGRAAPGVDALFTPGGRSYPSGHTATATFVWGMVASVVPRRAGRVLRWLPPLLTGAAMFLLTFHWLTDVLAGAAIGVLVLAVVRMLDRPLLAHWPGASRGTDPDRVAADDAGVAAGVRGDGRAVHDPRPADS